MTSTNMFSGNFAEKPSSRVLRPPGGGHSNIFGLPEEPKPQVQKPAETVDVVPKEPVQQKSENVEKQEQKPAPVVQSETRSYKSKMQGGAFNPITGEPTGRVNEPVKPQTSSITVKQPPGGASTRLW